MLFNSLLEVERILGTIVGLHEDFDATVALTKRVYEDEVATT